MSGREFRRGLALGTSLLASTILCLATPAQAQAAPGQYTSPADTAANEAPSGLEDIIVTARRREESAQNIPVAVTALSAAQIDRYDLTSLERVAASTPQFAVARASNGSGAQLTLRGIGSNTTSIGIEQSVAVVVDGVYYGQGRVINEGFFDLGRLEILKGPQALYFGKNATAGVVSITTADPTAKPEFLARVGYEFRSQNVVGEAIGSGPLSDTLGIRVAVRGSKMFGGYFRNRAVAVPYPSFDVATGQVINYTSPPGAFKTPKERELLGRVTLKWTPTDRLTATLKASASHNQLNNPAYNSVVYNCPNGFNQANPNNECAGKFQTYASGLPGPGNTMPWSKDDGRLYNDYKSWSTTGTINYALDNVNITSVTNYNWNRNKFSLDSDYEDVVSTIPATENTSFRAFSTELRALTSYDGPVNVMIGGYYQNTKRIFDQAVQLGNVQDSTQSDINRFAGFTKDSQTKGETLSAYGQVMWKLIKNVELAAGVRYTHETKDSYFVHPYVNAAISSLFIPNKFITANQVFTDWSPDATLTWKPTTDITVYGGYKTAYKSGGFSNSAILGAAATVDYFAFDPEKARGFEGGIKTTWADNQLRLNLGLYSYKYTNLQLDFFDATVIALITTNAGSAKTRGVELEAEFAPRAVPGLNLRGSINYNKATYGSFLAPCYGGQSIAAGCNLTFNPVSLAFTQQNLSGVSTSVAPRWTGSAGVNYETDMGSGLVLALSTDARYSSAYLASAFGSPASRNGRYVNLDASIRIKTSDDMYEVALIGKNLTNRFYVNGGIDAPNTGVGSGTTAAIPADQVGYAALPRTVQLQLTARF